MAGVAIVHHCSTVIEATGAGWQGAGTSRVGRFSGRQARRASVAGSLLSLRPPACARHSPLCARTLPPAPCRSGHHRRGVIIATPCRR